MISSLQDPTFLDQSRLELRSMPRRPMLRSMPHRPMHHLMLHQPMLRSMPLQPPLRSVLLQHPHHQHRSVLRSLLPRLSHHFPRVCQVSHSSSGYHFLSFHSFIYTHVILLLFFLEMVLVFCK